MRVALIRRRYTAFGGAERYTAAVAEGLARRGHEVHLFAERWTGDGGPRAAIRLHRVLVPPGPSFARVLAFAVGAARAVARERYDAIVSFERTLRQDVYRAGDGCHREWLLRRAASMAPGRRALVEANPLHATYLWLEGRIFRDPRCRLIIANSRRGRDEVVRHYGTDPDRIAVLYTGVDPEVYHPRHRGERRGPVRHALGLADGELTLLFVGSGFERKGLAPLLGALDLFYHLEVVRRAFAGMRLDYEFPAGIAALLLPVILAVSLIAALGPAESAVRSSLVEALEYE